MTYTPLLPHLWLFNAKFALIPSCRVSIYFANDDDHGSTVPRERFCYDHNTLAVYGTTQNGQNDKGCRFDMTIESNMYLDLTSDMKAYFKAPADSLGDFLGK